MRRVHGDKGLPLIECINPKIKKYRIRYDIQPYINEEGEEQGITFLESEILHKPYINEVKEIVLSGYNQAIDEKILSGFIWNDMPVWLSSENQFNYKAAYDLAVMAEGKTLPVVFKFGTTYEPIYYEFTTLDELSDFYLRAMKYINDCLSEGWKMKDGIDWSEYEEALKKL
jgi:hypothetical protein